MRTDEINDDPRLKYMSNDSGDNGCPYGNILTHAPIIKSTAAI